MAAIQITTFDDKESMKKGLDALYNRLVEKETGDDNH